MVFFSLFFFFFFLSFSFLFFFLSFFFSLSCFNKNKTVLNDPNIPQNGKMIALLIRSMGIEQFEMRVIHQLLEFMNGFSFFLFLFLLFDFLIVLLSLFLFLSSFLSPSCSFHLFLSLPLSQNNKKKNKIGYTTDVLKDAGQFRNHGGKKETIGTEEVRLAAQARINHTINHPSQRQVLFFRILFFFFFFFFFFRSFSIFFFSLETYFSHFVVVVFFPFVNILF